MKSHLVPNKNAYVQPHSLNNMNLFFHVLIIHLGCISISLSLSLSLYVYIGQESRREKKISRRRDEQEEKRKWVHVEDDQVM